MARLCFSALSSPDEAETRRKIASQNLVHALCGLRRLYLGVQKGMDVLFQYQGSSHELCVTMSAAFGAISGNLLFSRRWLAQCGP